MLRQLGCWSPARCRWGARTNQIRGVLPGFSYQCGGLVASAIPALLAIFAEHMKYSTAMAVTAVSVFLLTALIAALGKEKRGISFEAV